MAEAKVPEEEMLSLALKGPMRAILEEQAAQGESRSKGELLF